MNDVSKGNLGTRIHTEDTDSDSRKLADGFNRMLDEIDILMEQVKREEQQMTQMQLNALQSQIQPHFLYNTLECIHWQAAADGNREISTMVKALAQYYRICLSSGKDIITLGTELDHIRNYLIIQNMRYDNIINLKINIDKAYYNVEIPKLTLQPLVENSIYHGIRVEEGRKGIVEISARDEDEDIVILLADNGQGMGKEEIERINHTIREFDRTMGYGINNVNKRLELLFGSAYGLRFSPSEAGGLLVEIRLPKQREEKTDV
jgi:two-component system sensor histidine kinase YesM